MIRLTHIITMSIQKGGTGKSTTTGALGYILSQEKGLKTLVCDFDPQGNQTEMLTGCDTEEFEDQTILEGLVNMNLEPYILEVEKNLHLLPADDNLGIFPRRAFSRYYERDENGNVMLDEDGDIIISPEASTILKRALEPIKNYYDVILIDTPPMLSEFTSNALTASNAAVVIYQTHKFCYSAVRRFLETILDCQEEANPDLKMYGILSTMIDKRRSEANAYLEMILEKYGEIVFRTIINNKAAVARLPIYGLDKDNKELNFALMNYRSFADELLDRLENDQYYPITQEMIERDE